MNVGSMLQDRMGCVKEHKPLNQERTKNTRTHSPMYEHDFSLNRKYWNIHFTLNEEQ
jgi:hypothetical protein